MLFNLYTAGTRETRVLLSSHAEFADALAAWQASQSATTRETQGWLIVPVGDADELENFGELSGFNPGYFGPDKPGVYVTRRGDGVSCLGYGYAAKRGDGVADWLAMKGLTGVVPPRTDAPGTPGAWLHYQRAMKAGRRHNEITGQRCPLELTSPVDRAGGPARGGCRLLRRNPAFPRRQVNGLDALPPRAIREPDILRPGQRGAVPVGARPVKRRKVDRPRLPDELERVWREAVCRRAWSFTNPDGTPAKE